MTEQIEKLSHLEHILKRPDSYVGSTSKTSELYWVLEDSDFVQENLVYSPALLKIFDEILVNAIDRNSLYTDEVKNIKVLVDKNNGIISVENDGPLGGIEVKMHQKEKIYNPELTFGHLLTSTNYNDSQKRTVGGRNGYGSKLTNIYSNAFLVTICDCVNKVKYVQKWENNMRKVSPPKITKYSGKTSKVNITFVPDWKKFGMNGLDTDFYKIVEKRVFDANYCTSSKCSVFFQNQKLKKLSNEDYAKMYLEEDTKVVTVNTPRWCVSVAPSSEGHHHISFVNGICTTKGGTHVDYVSKMISDGIIEDLSKKIKLKSGQVKNTFFVCVKCTLENPSFSSQVKSECTLKIQEFGSRFEPPKTFIKNVLKTGIQDEVMSLSKFREMKELKKSDGSRRSRISGVTKLDDANAAGTVKSGKCTLILTEGDSAKTLAVAGLSVVGREYYGVYPLRGKCKNVRDASVKQLMSNQEFNDIKKILGLQQGKEYKSVDELRYGRLMIMTDADADGSHIKGLILNMIHYFWPSLIELGFVVSMVTPIIKASKGSQILSFYTESSFKNWYSTNKSGWKIKYYKGLGTSTSAEAKEYFKNIKKLTVSFEQDEETDNSIVLAFDKKKADSRKVWLLENSGKYPEVNYGNINSLSVTNFIHKDFVNFSLADLKRSVGHVVDGQKPSQRKVLYASFSKRWEKEPKVAQLAAYVSDKTCYHHGEVSLADTIVKLAQDFVGSNNINLMKPIGQFGSRLLGGKDAAQTRYIFTLPNDQARDIFDVRDNPILTYLEDDGNKIEPEYYVPILPMVLVNGTEGIGTGFSCYVPSFNPDDIKKNIRRALAGQTLIQMNPWFRGFKGSVTKSGDQSWILEGLWEEDEDGDLQITELPPGRWTQDLKEHLDDLVEKKTISGYKNKSTTENVDFEVYGYGGSTIVKDFKLQKTIHTSNMHLFHPTYGIKKYQSAEEILVDFLEIRIDYYKKRKAYILNKLKTDHNEFQNKCRFIEHVVEDKITIFRQKKAVIENQLEKLKFIKIGGSYEYLLNTKTYQYTEEEIEKIHSKLQNIEKEIQELKNTKVVDMWISDLEK
jgi:DNA topoisomerase-2